MLHLFHSALFCYDTHQRLYPLSDEHVHFLDGDSAFTPSPGRRVWTEVWKWRQCRSAIVKDLVGVLLAFYAFVHATDKTSWHKGGGRKYCSYYYYRS